MEPNDRDSKPSILNLKPESLPPSCRRLDELVTSGGLLYFPVLTMEWREAAAFWADARQRGFPTASADALDDDVILAACAATIGRPGDLVIVATNNVGHPARYCDARSW